MDRSSHFPQRGDHSRVHLLIELGYPGVVSIHRQQILGQIVGTNGHKVGLFGQQPRLINRSGHFDQDPHLGALHLNALFNNLVVGLVYQHLGAS